VSDAPSRRLLFLGPALGGHPGWVTTQGEVLAGLFREENRQVQLSSDRISPVGRAVDHARDLVRGRRSIEVAVVSVFSGRGFALAAEAIAVARSLRIPTVAWLHGGNLPRWSEGHQRATRRLLQSASAVVAPTAYLGRWAAVHRTDVRVIPNVVDLSTCPHRIRSSFAPRLLWMRTFQELYDPVTAVRTLEVLRGRGLDATLTMAGQDKGLLDATRAAAAAAGIADHVTFPGFASGTAKATLLDGHDIFLNTNLVDNAPVTVVEAAASGLVVVSSDVGGIPDLLADGVSGRLVRPGDPQAMADAVAFLLDDQAAARSIADGGRAVAERSGWPEVRRAWLDLWAELSDRRERRG
jgi:glycosyltransferase involved in cell wall biosynthesis